MIRRLWHKLVDPIDGPLIAMAGFLMLVSFVLLSSAAPERLEAQVVNLGVALVVMRVAQHGEFFQREDGQQAAEQRGEQAMHAGARFERLGSRCYRAPRG